MILNHLQVLYILPNLLYGSSQVVALETLTIVYCPVAVIKYRQVKEEEIYFLLAGTEMILLTMASLASSQEATSLHFLYTKEA